MDMRIKKTQRALITALQVLLEKQSFDKITVNDLCAEAMISRSAFYSHFEDKFDLLRAAMKTSVCERLENAGQMDLRGRIQELLTHFGNDSRILMNVISSGYHQEILTIVHESLQSGLEMSIENGELSAEQIEVPLDLFTLYYSTGISSLVLYWLEKNKPYSIEEMADYFITLIPEKYFQAC